MTADSLEASFRKKKYGSWARKSKVNDNFWTFRFSMKYNNALKWVHLIFLSYELGLKTGDDYLTIVVI